MYHMYEYSLVRSAMFFMCWWELFKQNFNHMLNVLNLQIKGTLSAVRKFVVTIALLMNIWRQIMLCLQKELSDENIAKIPMDFYTPNKVKFWGGIK